MFGEEDDGDDYEMECYDGICFVSVVHTLQT